jgi:diacylglycerol kinase (ATP)
VKRRALLLINPRARRGEETRLQVLHHLQQLGFELIEESTEHLDRLPDMIRHHQHQVDRIIVGGGDGTVNAAIAGFLDTHLPVGILPLGTANNLARTLGIPSSLEDACRVVAQDTLQAIDLGWVNGKYFLNVAGMGISTDINRTVEASFKRRWGGIAYAMTALKVISRYRRFTAEIHLEGKSVVVKTFQITVCNGRHYGSGMTVAADATIDDQRLDLCSLEIRHWWEAIALIPALKRGEYATGQRVRVLQGQDIEIHTAYPQPIDTDGEITTQTPAKFRVIPKAISVFVPT